MMYYHGCPCPTLLSSLSVTSASCNPELVLMACSSQAINQVIEAPYDKIIKRTQNRPIPNGKISKFQGSCISAVLGTTSLVLFSQFGTSTCLVAMGIWGGYVCLYKRVTRFNTHIGTVIGAALAYLGWVADSGTFMGLEPFFMSFYMFSWQFPHFYGIVWTCKQEFEEAGYEMITKTDNDGRISYRNSVLGSVGQLIASIGLAYTGSFNPYFLPFGVLACLGSVIHSLGHFKAVNYIYFPNNITGSKLYLFPK